MDKNATDFAQELRDLIKSEVGTLSGTLTEQQNTVKEMTQKLSRFEESGFTEEKVKKLGELLETWAQNGFKGSNPLAVSVPGVDTKKFSICRMMAANAQKGYFQNFTWDNAPYEQEVLRETKKQAEKIFGDDVHTKDETKTLYPTQPTAVDAIIPEELSDDIIEIARSSMVQERVGMRSVNVGGAGSPVNFSRQTGAVSGAWIPETGTIVPEDQAWVQEPTNPHKAVAATVFSNSIMRIGITGNQSIEQLVREDIAQGMMRLKQIAWIDGQAGSDPEGFLNNSNVLNVTRYAGAAGDVDAIVEWLLSFPEAIDVADGVIGDRPHWIMLPATKWLISKLKDSDDVPLMTRTGNTITDRVEEILFGYPVASTNDFRAVAADPAFHAVAFGNFTQTMEIQWGPMELDSSNVAEDWYLQDLMGVRSIHEVDYFVRRPDSIAWGDGLQ